MPSLMSTSVEKVNGRLNYLLRRVARACGNSYLTQKGKLMPPKKIGPECKCRLRCFITVDAEMRQKLFNHLYHLADYEEQTKYLASCIENEDVKTSNGKINFRKLTTRYYLDIYGSKTQVCRMAFASIFGLSNKRVTVLREKVDKDELCDLRGKFSHKKREIGNLPFLSTDNVTHDKREQNSIQVDDTEVEKCVKENGQPKESENLSAVKLTEELESNKIKNNQSREVESSLENFEDMKKRKKAKKKKHRKTEDEVDLSPKVTEDLPELKIKKKKHRKTEVEVDSSSRVTEDLPELKIKKKKHRKTEVEVDSSSRVTEDLPELKIKKKKHRKTEVEVDSSSRVTEDLPELKIKKKKRKLEQLEDGFVDMVDSLQTEQFLKKLKNDENNDEEFILDDLRILEPTPDVRRKYNKKKRKKDHEDVLSGKNINFEVNKEVKDSLTIYNVEQGAEELQKQLHCETVEQIPSDQEEGKEEEAPTSLIREICLKWLEVKCFVKQYHPDKAVTNDIINTFNDDVMRHFKFILKKRRKQQKATSLCEDWGA